MRSSFDQLRAKKIVISAKTASVSQSIIYHLKVGLVIDVELIKEPSDNWNQSTRRRKGLLCSMTFQEINYLDPFSGVRARNKKSLTLGCKLMLGLIVICLFYRNAPFSYLKWNINTQCDYSYKKVLLFELLIMVFYRQIGKELYFNKMLNLRCRSFLTVFLWNSFQNTIPVLLLFPLHL